MVCQLRVDDWNFRQGPEELGLVQELVLVRQKLRIQMRYIIC